MGGFPKGKKSGLMYVSVVSTTSTVYSSAVLHGLLHVLGAKRDHTRQKLSM
jgi:hypothetical protein